MIERENYKSDWSSRDRTVPISAIFYPNRIGLSKLSPDASFTYFLDRKSSTSTQVSIWRSVDQKETITFKPPSTTNASNILSYNNLLNNIFNNISTEKSIYVNLIDLPPSSWNFSLSSNASINLNVELPPPVYPATSNTKTNLTFTNIEANHFSTNIIGKPVNLQVDRVQTKQFSLKMNTTNSDPNSSHRTEHASDVIIGHVKSERFALNLTKSDNMHVHVQQVDSATAELYLDSNFCTNESSLQINLNLSKNGKKNSFFF